MTACECGSLLHGLAAKPDRFGVAARKVMGGSKSHIEYGVLRVVRTHANRLLKMRDRPVRLSIERKGPTEIAMGSREIRIEIDGALELLNCLLGATPRESHVPER